MNEYTDPNPEVAFGRKFYGPEADRAAQQHEVMRILAQSARRQEDWRSNYLALGEMLFKAADNLAEQETPLSPHERQLLVASKIIGWEVRAGEPITEGQLDFETISFYFAGLNGPEAMGAIHILGQMHGNNVRAAKLGAARKLTTTFIADAAFQQQIALGYDQKR